MERKLIILLIGAMGVVICGVCALCILPSAFFFAPVRHVALANAPYNQGTGEATSGKALFSQYGCAGCHKAGGVGPDLAGIYGKTVKLQDGSTLVVDNAYLRRAILDSQAEIVAGYLPIMPRFEGQISDAETDLLVEYIRSLSE